MLNIPDKLKLKFFLTVLLTSTVLINAQTTTLDDFENDNGWSVIKSDGVNLTILN